MIAKIFIVTLVGIAFVLADEGGQLEDKDQILNELELTLSSLAEVIKDTYQQTLDALKPKGEEPSEDRKAKLDKLHVTLGQLGDQKNQAVIEAKAALNYENEGKKDPKIKARLESIIKIFGKKWKLAKIDFQIKLKEKDSAGQ